MKKILFARNNNALAGVIEALLLVALVAIVLSTIQLYYIPEIMKQKEADHMDTVENQFAQLKSVIESQGMMGSLQPDDPISHTIMSSPVTLGHDRLPYFISSWALGHVNINDKDTELDSKIVLPNGDLPAKYRPRGGIPLTSIQYHAQNAYFIDQNFILEGGGIILEQSNGEAMKVSPPIYVKNYTDVPVGGYDGYLELYYTIPIINSKTGKRISETGIDTTYVLTNYSETISNSEDGVTYIQIYSDYLEAWNQSLKNDNKGILWEYCTDNEYITVEYDDDDNPTYIEIKPEAPYRLDIKFTLVEMYAQIGPGFII